MILIIAGTVSVNVKEVFTEVAGQLRLQNPAENL